MTHSPTSQGLLPFHSKIAVASGASAIGCFVVLHVVMAGVVDPISDPVSGYALWLPGAPLFIVGSVALAVCCGALAIGGIGLGNDVVLRMLLTGASVGLTVSASFPTDLSRSVSSVSGYVHRYSAGVAFALITLVGLLVVMRIRGFSGGIALGRFAGVLTVLSVCTLTLTVVNTLYPALANGGSWRGVPQRLMLLVLVLTLMMVALIPRFRQSFTHSQASMGDCLPNDSRVLRSGSHTA